MNRKNIYWSVVVCALMAHTSCGDSEPVLPEAAAQATGIGGSSAGSPGSDDEPSRLALSFDSISLDSNPSFVTHFEFLPGSHEFLATTRHGRVLHYLLEQDSTTLLGEFEIPVFVEQDCGLISLTLDPEFDDNGLIYLGYCTSLTESAIVRFRFDASAYAEVPQSGVEILRVGDATAARAVHSVGKMGFDSNENLWATFGDKGVSEAAQDAATPLGALVRLRPKPAGGYEAPVPANPRFDTSPEIPLVYAYGLRSPWTALLDSQARYWVGDVGASGDDSVEEINLIAAAGFDQSRNFGWNRFAGPCESECSGLSDPIRSWSRRPTSDFELEDPEVSATSTRVAWVGVEYTELQHDQYAGLMNNKVLYGDMCLGFVRAIEVDTSMQVVFDENVGHLAGASAWQVGPDGFIYAVTYRRCTHSTDVELPAGQLMRARLVQPPG